MVSNFDVVQREKGIVVKKSQNVYTIKNIINNKQILYCHYKTLSRGRGGGKCGGGCRKRCYENQTELLINVVHIYK